MRATALNALALEQVPEHRETQMSLSATTIFLGSAIGAAIGGLALLGFVTGLFSSRLKLRPLFSSLLAWCVQAPYVLLTDYVWFVYSLLMPPNVATTVITTILINLTIEVVIASILAEIIVRYLKRIGISLDYNFKKIFSIKNKH